MERLVSLASSVSEVNAASFGLLSGSCLGDGTGFTVGVTGASILLITTEVFNVSWRDGVTGGGFTATVSRFTTGGVTTGSGNDLATTAGRGTGNLRGSGLA